ncbi:ATP phosphoribosyltransferase [Vulcanisaeta thermophila]|uniref:ATP phosphoribosyltransferase n=1 Tax=Vulcanisaeta thermophila TaxID=867917 RepID=UPI0008536F3E|nr:ATP phosphoribosyltransferase [Vulcanisaeta thermophila]
MAIPSKGRLVGQVIDLLNAIGLRLQSTDDRSLIIPTNWPELSIVRVRTEDIPNIVGGGSVELGITGLDYVVESGAPVKVLERLGFGRGSLVLAVPVNSGIESIDDIKDGFKVATKYVNITKNFFNEVGREVRVIGISGSAEIMPLLGVADAIVDVMSTGTTLRLHGLKPIAKIMDTEAVLIGNDEDDEVVRKFLLLLRGTLRSRNKKLVLMNVPLQSIDKVLSILPAMEGPTVADIAGKPFKEVISVVPEDELPTLLTRLRDAGAKDILVMSIEKVI